MYPSKMQSRSISMSHGAWTWTPHIPRQYTWCLSFTNSTAWWVPNNRSAIIHQRAQDCANMHQSYLVEHFQTGFAGTELTPEVAKHSAHCFDYIRQSIMCSADTSLEGNTEAGPGWGSKHECTDYDALLNWVNENTLVRWRGNGPDTSGL